MFDASPVSDVPVRASAGSPRAVPASDLRQITTRWQFGALHGQHVAHEPVVHARGISPARAFQLGILPRQRDTPPSCHLVTVWRSPGRRGLSARGPTVLVVVLTVLAGQALAALPA